MSYTIEIWSRRLVKLPDALPDPRKWRTLSHAWWQGGKTWAITVTPPIRMMPEDIPPRIAKQLPGIQYVMIVGLMGQVPEKAIDYFHNLARNLAQASTGVLLDRWEGTLWAPSSPDFPGRSRDISMNAEDWFIEHLITPPHPRFYSGHLTMLPGSRSAFIGGRRVLFRWDIDTGTVEQLFSDSSDAYRLSDAAALPDGKRVLIAMEGRSPGLWNLQTRKLIHKLQGHTAFVHQVATLPDGYRAVSASKDKTLRIWDVNTYETLHVLQGHQAAVICVAVLPDGNRILSGSQDGYLGLWDANTGECMQMWQAHDQQVSAVAVFPDGQQVLSGNLNGSILGWNLETTEIVYTFNGHSARITALALLPDGKRLVSAASSDLSLRLWHVEEHTHDPIGVFQIADLPPGFSEQREVPSIVKIHRMNYMEDLAVLDDDHVIGADIKGNLYVINVLPL